MSSTGKYVPPSKRMLVAANGQPKPQPRNLSPEDGVSLTNTKPTNGSSPSSSYASYASAASSSSLVSSSTSTSTSASSLASPTKSNSSHLVTNNHPSNPHSTTNDNNPPLNCKTRKQAARKAHLLAHGFMPAQIHAHWLDHSVFYYLQTPLAKRGYADLGGADRKGREKETAGALERCRQR